MNAFLLLLGIGERWRTFIGLNREMRASYRKDSNTLWRRELNFLNIFFFPPLLSSHSRWRKLISLVFFCAIPFFLLSYTFTNSLFSDYNIQECNLNKINMKTIKFKLSFAALMSHSISFYLIQEMIFFPALLHPRPEMNKIEFRIFFFVVRWRERKMFKSDYVFFSPSTLHWKWREKYTFISTWNLIEHVEFVYAVFFP